MGVRALRFGYALLMTAFLSACSSSSTAPTPPAPQSLYVADRTTGKIFVYSLPTSASATPTVTLSTGFTTLYDAVINGGVLYVDNDLSPSVIYGYPLPLTASSTTTTTINTTGTSNAFSFTFDPSGNLWLADNNNNRVLGYHGPFSGVSSPVAFTTISAGISQPWNLISDAAGNLYLTANTTVQILNAPPSGVNVTFSPLTEPIPMQLDSAGNIYTADFSTGNLYRYNAPFAQNQTPSITDLKANTTLASPYYMALDNAGNLYVSDCSTSIKVFATGSFSSTSVPSFTLPLPAGATCSTGLAIH